MVNQRFTSFNGLYKKWYHTGQLMEICNYTKGKKDGSFESWHDNGQMAIKCNYLRGKKYGLYKTWYRNGKMQEKCNYECDKKDGLYKSWYEQNGNLHEKCNFVKGKRNGSYELRYRDSGTLHIRCSYVNNEKNGLYESWYYNGQLEEVFYYANVSINEQSSGMIYNHDAIKSNQITTTIEDLHQLTTKLPPFPETDKPCPICIDMFQSNDPRAILSCNHAFHFDCIGTWLQTNNNCPICRKIITLK